MKIYIEGGGDSADQDAAFREGWSKLFQRVGLRRKPRVVRGGGRGQTFSRFRSEIENNEAWLLVDSEDFPENPSIWQHLHDRDQWIRPDGASEDHVFLMVVCMETWFLADTDALGRFFRPNFKERHIPQWPDLERIPKATILQTLQRATSGQYQKGRRSFELLATIDLARVAEHCKAAKRLLDRLHTLSREDR